MSSMYTVRNEVKVVFGQAAWEVESLKHPKEEPKEVVTSDTMVKDLADKASSSRIGTF